MILLLTVRGIVNLLPLVPTLSLVFTLCSKRRKKQALQVEMTSHIGRKDNPTDIDDQPYR
jgi:hypothetical protein